MKICGFKNLFKKRTYIYLSGRILIKSEIKLTEQQRKEIFDIIRKNVENPYYGYQQQMTRKIFHKLENLVYGVEFSLNRIGYLVKIKSFKSH